MSSTDVPSVFTKDHPFPAKIVENRLLSRPGSAKETRHLVVEISGSGLSYKVGDSLGIFPTNRVTEVAELIERLQATGDEPVSPAMLKLASPLPLREVLTSRLTLASLVCHGPHLFHCVARFSFGAQWTRHG